MRHGSLLVILLTLYCGIAAGDPPRNCAPRVPLEALTQELRYSWSQFAVDFRSELRDSLRRAHAPGSQIQLSASQNRLVEFLMEHGMRGSGSRVPDFTDLVRTLESQISGPDGFSIARAFMTPEGRIIAVPWGTQ